jgi:hypothetical protein
MSCCLTNVEVLQMLLVACAAEHGVLCTAGCRVCCFLQVAGYVVVCMGGAPVTTRIICWGLQALTKRPEGPCCGVQAFLRASQ